MQGGECTPPGHFLSACLLPSCGGSWPIFLFLQEFALTNPEKREKSSTKETERKETVAEEELEPEILEVFHPTHEWQALHPGTKPSPVSRKHT